MWSYHSAAVKQSRLLFDRTFGSTGFEARIPEDNCGPDLAFYQGTTLAGLGEVKTLVEKQKTQLSAELYRKGNGSWNVPLPEGSGLWTVHPDPHANVKKALALVRDYFSQNVEPSEADRNHLGVQLSAAGFHSLKEHRTNGSDRLIINPPSASLSPIDSGINPDVLFKFFIEQLGRKKAVEEVRNSQTQHRHIFLWPDETRFPDEVFAAHDFPEVLPKLPQIRLTGFTHVWIGHRIPRPQGTVSGWLYTESLGWRLIQTTPDE